MATGIAGSTPQSSPFIRQLTSSGQFLRLRRERKVRERALSSLRTYLHRNALFSPLDCLKLWKGLFYCMFMTDKPRNQQKLARDLAALVDALTTRENVLGFLDGFWKTMGREWGGIDSLRMDKYLYLVRCYVSKGFEVCSKQGWTDRSLLEDYLKILRGEGGPLSSRDARVPNGLRLHVLDVWFDELDKVDSDRTAPIEKFVSPIQKLGKESIVKSVRDRAKEALSDERIDDWVGGHRTPQGLGMDEDGKDEEFGGFQD